MSEYKAIIRLPSIEYLRECFDYDPEAGELRWKARPREHFTTTNVWATMNTKVGGKVAGNIAKTGYRVVTIGLREYSVHRVVWKLMTNEEPPPELDHVNGVRADNRWCNLRAANRYEQGYNRERGKNNTSGYRGVWRRRGRREDWMRWVASIRIDGVVHHLGGFATAQEASHAYENAARKLHGKFYREPQER